MKVSIVTVCRNANRTIVDCLSSVLYQEGADIEYIVIDGQSTDDTLRRIEPFAGRIARLVSEKDAGIYDAMNKGLSLANGEVIGFLNADDIFATHNVVATIVEEFKTKRIDIVFGDVEIYTDAGRLIRIYRGNRFHPNAIRSGCLPPHPTFYARTGLLRNAGGFNTHFKIAADFDLMMRAFLHQTPSWTYLPQTLVRMRAGGASNQGLSSYMTISRELIAACRNNGIKPNKLAIHGRVVRKCIEVADATMQRLIRPL